MNQSDRWLDSSSRFISVVAMIAVIIGAAAILLGVGHNSTTELFSLEAWYRAAKGLLRDL